MLRRTHLLSFWVGMLLIVSVLAQMWGTSIANISRILLYPMWMMSIPVIIVLFKNRCIPKCGQLMRVLGIGCSFIVYCLLVHQGVGGFMKFAGTVILCYTTGFLLSSNRLSRKIFKIRTCNVCICYSCVGLFYPDELYWNGCGLDE